MKTRKKILIAIITVFMVCFASFAAACKEDDGFYKVTFVYDNGQPDTVVSVESGNTVTEPRDPERGGYEFLGWFLEGETETSYDFSSPVRKDFSLYAHWQQGTASGIRLTWIDRGEAYDFVFEGGKAPSEAKAGDVVTFSVKVSPFYLGTPVVTARVGEEDQTLTENNGAYSFTVPATEETVSFSVAGLDLDRTPIRGTGTSSNPYLIETPAQFRRFGLSVNSESDEKYNEACIRLAADLDFKGESLDPIGTDLSSTYFSGEFDGNGKTISNLVPGTDIELLVGVFGYAVQASIHDLTIACDYDLRLDRQQNYCVGGIVAYNIGSDIVGCNFNGNMTVDMASPYDSSVGGLVYVGGIVGFAQGYSTDYSAAIAYCTVSGDIQSTGRYPLYAVGGIAGATVGTAESAPVLVTNCTYGGNVGGSGGIRVAGGAIGYLREYSGASNLYTEGSVSAYYTEDPPAAGGLVGFAENETALVSSYSASTHEAIGKEIDSNMTEGDVVGAYYKDGKELTELPLTSIDGRKVFLHDAYEVKEGKVGTADAADFAAVKALLGWSDADWTFENGKPCVNRAGEQSISVDVTFSFGTHKVAFETEEGEEEMGEREVTITDAYLPINWIFEGSGMNTFVAEGDYVSYGYFLDAALTQRIPSAMPLTRSMTIYVGFADYGDVVGEYYAVVPDEDGQHEVKLTFNNRGMMTMYSEGMLAYEMYVWDGEKILIRDAYFANFVYSVEDLSLDNDYYAEFNDNKTLLTIYDNYFYTNANLNEVTKPILTYPKNEAMGEWYSADDTYVFFSNSTGTSGLRGSFTYTCAERLVTITFAGSSLITATISEDGKTMAANDFTLSVTRLDDFAGTWEAEYGYNMSITFDGKGSFTYGETEGTYETEGDTATLSNGITASFDEDGLLVFNESGRETVMGREGSYIGTWTDDVLGYTLVMTGIGRDGYGFAYDSRGIDLTYRAVRDTDTETTASISDITVIFWYRTNMYGMGNEGFSSGEHGPGSLLYLAMYTPESGYMVDDYNMAYVDQFAGVWNASDGTSLEFNGYGGYDINTPLSSLGTSWVVEGWVTHTAADGTESEVRYEFDRATGKATFTVGTTEYTAVFNGDTLSVTHAGAEAAVYREPDLFGGASFQSASGDALSFNGKSNVGLGKATVTESGVKTEYDYTLEGERATLTKEGVPAYTAEIDSETYYLVVTKSGEESGVSYGYYSAAFGKTWYGPNGTRVKLNEVFALDGLALGEFAGAEDVVFELLDPESGTIGVYLYYDSIPSYYLVPIDESALALFDEEETLIGILCLPDGWEGTYTSEDGDVLVIDGRSAVNEYYYYAQADFTLGEEQLWLVYTVEDGGLVLSELDRDGEEDRLIARYYVSRTQTEGAVAYTSEDGTVVYVTEAQE